MAALKYRIDLSFYKEKKDLSPINVTLILNERNLGKD